MMVLSVMAKSTGYGIPHASGKSRDCQPGRSEPQKSGRLPKGCGRWYATLTI